MSGTSILSYIIFTLSIGYLFAYPTWNNISSLKNEKAKYEDSLSMIANIENKKNELLTEFNKITSDDDFANIIRGKSVGDKITLTVLSKGLQKTVTVRLAQAPDGQ